jgi:hypothetical protein
LRGQKFHLLFASLTVRKKNIYTDNTRLIVRNKKGEYIVLQNFGHVVINWVARKLGINLQRMVLPSDVEMLNSDAVEILYQPDPQSKRAVKSVAKAEKLSDGQTGFVINDQVVTC